MTSIVVLVVIVGLFGSSSAIDGDNRCSVVNRTESGDKTKLLSEIGALNGHQFSVQFGGDNYTLRWCSDLMNKNGTLIKTSNKGQTTVMGRRNVTDIVVIGNSLMVTFAGGDYINNTNYCSGERWKAVFLLECTTSGNESIKVIDPMNAGCFAVFSLNSVLACRTPPTPSPPPVQPTSRWTVFFMLLLTAAICYLVIGMAYRRFVTGAKGMEQIPNYDFWRDPCGYTRDYCNRRDMRRNEPWSNASTLNDNVDEPLLHP